MSRQDRAATEWLVMLEAADETGGPGMDLASFDRLVRSWPNPAPTTLYSPDRYAVQVPVAAASAASALSSATSLWKDALRRADLPDWELVRAEILTPAELERELQAADRQSDAAALQQLEAARMHDVVGNDLLRRALHDSVTGLPSRAVFVDEIRRALAAAPVIRETHAVMVVSLDGLGAPGRPLDHPATNGVLVEVVRRLVRTVRRGDTVARVGQAEFALLVGVTSRADVDRLTERIARTLRVPIVHQGRAVALTPFVGVATVSHGRDADELFRIAEAAMAVKRDAGCDCQCHPAPRGGVGRTSVGDDCTWVGERRAQDS